MKFQETRSKVSEKSHFNNIKILSGTYTLQHIYALQSIACVLNFTTVAALFDINSFHVNGNCSEAIYLQLIFFTDDPCYDAFSV